MTAMSVRLAFQIPVIGWLAKDAIHGLPDAKYWFFANILMVLAASVYVFGYPALIIFALGATALAFVALFILTGSDLVEQARRNRAAAHSSVPSQLVLRERNKD